MIGNDTITALLETFQGCKERGEKATLFLETRNGVQFATFKVKVPDSHQKDKTSLESTKKKAPSTVKRDKERLEKFNQRKKLFRGNCSFRATSTPSSKCELLEAQVSIDQDMVTQALDNKMDKLANETVSDEPGDATDFEQGQFGEDEILSKEDEKNLENSSVKSLKEVIAEPDQIKNILNNMISKKDLVKKDDEIEEDDDNIEGAKLWALKQKQNFTFNN